MNNQDRNFPRSGGEESSTDLERETNSSEGSTVSCKWCGASLKSNTAAFCSECKAPQTVFGYIAYATDFVGKTLAIPLTIVLVTFVLTKQQQESSLTLSSRQKLAEGLGEVGKIQADIRLAYSQINFMAATKDDTVPTKELRDAVMKYDVAIDSYGAKLGPFEEFARRPNYYGPLAPGEPTRLQKVWDQCFVKPYYGDDKTPGYLSQIKDKISTCGGNTCPKAVAQELRETYDKFYLGFCDKGDPTKSIPQVWFNRELKRISVQVDNPEPYNPGID